MLRFFLSICFFFSIITVKAQFVQRGGFNTNQSTTNVDTLQHQGEAKPPFKIKRYFSALIWRKDSLENVRVQKDTLPIGRVWSGAIVLPGYSQAYNRNYWKIPIVYGAVGTSLFLGYQNNLKYMETGLDRYATNRNLWYSGAFLSYWGALLDGVMCYKSDLDRLPGRASLYSALIPGLGQAYNGDFWKIPIYCGGLMVGGYFIQFNNMQYQRFRNNYNDPDYSGRLTSENLKWYRDTYRRYRDYSILATILVYALTIMDANIFAYLQDFDVSDDLALRFSPGIIEPIHTARFASITPPLSVGLKMKISF